MIKVVSEVAKQHHEKNQRQYDEFTLQFADQLFIDAVQSFLHHMTGGIRPLKRVALESQKSELLCLNLNRVFHEVYCKPKEKFPPLPSFLKVLQEQTDLLLTLVATEVSNVQGETQIEQD